MRRFGEKMRTLRERRNMTIRELAVALGYPAENNSYISMVEMGKRVPKAEFMLKVADLFGVTMDQLTRDDQEV
ncbi:MAG: helix-turn-helix transcriptional regulator [Chloroflexaceae bacterium]|nr:helix-turn-helix transcriptional regulator [Chloroflexaceae bacterium]